MWHWAWDGAGYALMWCWTWEGGGQVDIPEMGGGGTCTGEYRVTVRISYCDVRGIKVCLATVVAQ